MSKLSRRIHRVARPRRRHEQPRLARVRALDVRQPLPARRKLPTVVRGHVRRESGRKAQESFPALSRLIIYTERMIISKCVIYTRIELCNSSNIGTKRKNDISHPLRTGLFFVRVGSFLDVPKIRLLNVALPLIFRQLFFSLVFPFYPNGFTQQQHHSAKTKHSSFSSSSSSCLRRQPTTKRTFRPPLWLDRRITSDRAAARDRGRRQR